MSVTLLLYIIVVHWVADFVLQSHKMASNKSSSNYYLLSHVSVYTAVLAVALWNPWYGVVNGVIHGAVDYVTSRWTGKLWKKGDIHNFFVVIGLDQLIHMITLVVTAKYLLG